LVLAAQALIVLDRTEYARAEQPVALRLERTIVDGFRLLDLAVGPRQNLLRTRNRDADLVEDLSRHLRAEKIHDLLVHLVLHPGRRRTGDRCLPPFSIPPSSVICPLIATPPLRMPRRRP